MGAPGARKPCEADPANPLIRSWLGRLDYDAGRYAAAAKRFEGIVEADETFMKAFDNLGLCYEALNQPEQAITAYRKAIALNRASTDRRLAASEPGTLLRNARRARRGGNPVARGGEYDASASKADHQLGVLLEQQDHPDEAVAALKHARPVTPPTPIRITRSRASTVAWERPKPRRRRWPRFSACTTRSAKGDAAVPGGSDAPGGAEAPPPRRPPR